jgi:hypothetical protein
LWGDIPCRYFSKHWREEEKVLFVDNRHFDVGSVLKGPFKTQSGVKAGEASTQNDDMLLSSLLHAAHLKAEQIV